ncbi:MAG: hypothetical protein KGJ55_03180 [Gammaproteobacteria bacterium]|nr:hypothetical protein [Gammaproteobacteria bacterium]
MVGRNTDKAQGQPPLHIELSLRFVFGPGSGEAVQVFDAVPVPLVGSVFQARDRIARGFTRTLLKAGLTQPRVLTELLPLLARRKRGAQ